MRVLLDENLDHRLRRSFDRSIEVTTVAEQGWKGKRNLADMQPLIPRVCEMLPTLRPGTIVCVAVTTPPEAPEIHNRGASGRS